MGSCRSDVGMGTGPAGPTGGERRGRRERLPKLGNENEEKDDASEDSEGRQNLPDNATIHGKRRGLLSENGPGRCSNENGSRIRGMLRSYQSIEIVNRTDPLTVRPMRSIAHTFLTNPPYSACLFLLDPFA